MRHRALLATAVLLLTCTAPAGAAMAPGRLTLPLDWALASRNPDSSPPFRAVALPDRAVVLAGFDAGQAVFVKLQADGSIDRTFGSGGYSRFRLSYDASDGSSPYAVLRRPDGRLLVAFGRAAPPLLEPLITVASVTADGRLDESFGDHGFAGTGIHGLVFAAVALDADGSLLVTGTSPDDMWAVARITADGAPAQDFGEHGVATIPIAGAPNGTDLSIGRDGNIAVLGAAGFFDSHSDASFEYLTVLKPDGTPDAAFHHGTLLEIGPLYGAAILARPDGAVDVLSTHQLRAPSLRRFTSEGTLDRSFGDHGRVLLRTSGAVQTLLPARDGSDVIVTADGARADPYRVRALRIARVSSNGALISNRLVAMGFAGGSAPRTAPGRPVRRTPLDQTTFTPGVPILRSDDALLIPGTVSVYQPTASADRVLLVEEALTMLRPDFHLDPSFGSPARSPARVALQIPRQVAAVDARPARFGVALDVSTSGPGIAVLEVHAGGLLVARSTEPLVKAGTTRLTAVLTAAGARVLRHAHGLPVTARATFRDLIGERAQVATRGVLR